MAKCTGVTKSGKACSAAPIKGKSRCLFHSKPKSAGYMISRKTRKSKRK